MFSADAKILLKNVIRHTKTHNRLLEEADMWKQREERGKCKRRHSPLRGSSEPRGRTSPVRGSSKCNGRRNLVEGPAGVQLSRAHMDWDVGDSTGIGREEEDTSTYWRRQLLKAEETDPDRWGHSGFKELYKEFDSDTSHSEDNKQNSSHGSKKNCKKKYKRSKTKGHGEKSSHKERHRHRSRSTDEAETDAKEEDASDRKRAKRHKKSAVKYVWVEKQALPSSDEQMSKKTSVKCSNTRCDDKSDNDSRDSLTEGATAVSMKHKKEHSSLHKSHHKKHKSKHKSKHAKQEAVS